jgi:DNA-binding NtrC family response regulator
MLLRTLLVATPGSIRANTLRAQLETGAEALVVEARPGRGLEAQLAHEPWDLVVVDSEALPELSPEWIRALRAADGPDVIVLASREGPAARAALLQAGALAAIEPGLDAATLGAMLWTLADRHRARGLLRIAQLPSREYRLSDYASASPAMQRLLATAHRVAGTDSTLLILGETGVGKGLLARSIHNEGPRAGQAFVTVNCSALPETLLESELFGHVKGAFTGALRSRRGQFELAHRGTLFLDEITEIPPHLQVKLLRVIDERVFQPLGSEKEIAVDVRVIAASNRDPSTEVREKRLRSDLYYRLNVVSLSLPALRERVEDIPELAQSYAADASRRFNANVTGIAPEALDALVRYAWPGNIRELKNVVERAVLLGAGPELGCAELPLELGEAPRALSPALVPARTQAIDASAWVERPWSEVRDQVLDDAERRYLTAVLTRYAGRVGDAAAHAGIASRSLFEKMRRHGLRKEDFRRSVPRKPTGAVSV